MNYDVSKLSREQLIQISIRTADYLRARLQTLEDNFQSYSENYTDEALALLHSYHPFADAVKMMYESNEFDRLDTNGLREMAKLSLRISKAYRLLVFTPDDQKEYDETIAQFKKDVYAEANKRLQKNKTELVYYRKTLLCELGNKEGEHLKPVYEYFNLASEYWYNDEVIKTDTRKKIGNPQSRIYRNTQILEEMQNLIKTYPLVEFLQHYRYDYDCNTLKQGINDLCDRIGEAQKKVQERLDKEKYPIWELTPVIAGLFANNEFYTEERQEYICDWVSEQERIDELVDVFKNAIPVALSILAFFMPAGIALIVQIINTAAGAAATIEDIQQATNTKELVYSQYNVSYEAEKVLTEANLSQAEFNLAMAVFSGVFVVADFADTIKLAKKLGIGDQVMRLFAKGTATKEEIHELVQITKTNIVASNLNNLEDFFSNSSKSVKEVFDSIPAERLSKLTNLPKSKLNYFNELNDENLIKVLKSEKCEEIIDSFSYIKKRKDIDRIIKGVDNIDTLPKLLKEPLPERIAGKIPEKYEARFKAGFAKKSYDDKNKILSEIEELYDKYGRAKTMQDHHWIEQSRIKDTARYPFLQQPPMRTNLLTDDSNLSLIVGHNGGHTSFYNEELLDKQLKELRNYLRKNFGPNYMANPEQIADIVNIKIDKIIKNLKESVDGKKILNGTTAYVIDFVD